MKRVFDRLHRLVQRLWSWLQRQLRGKPSGRRPARERRSLTHVDWVLPGKLAVGASPQPGDSAILRQAGIQVVFSLCGASEESLPRDVEEQFRCLRLVLPDSRYKREIKPSQLHAALDIIHHSVQNQLPIYVHCYAGVERSPTVCIAYLCKYHNLELWEALNWLKQVHPATMPQESQLKAVRNYLQGSAPASSNPTTPEETTTSQLPKQS
ncbi:MAG: dual specificity protein phosphatase family protein [Cyanobacteria bacterium]|nr:dual specificity protein phosphatase family protein [Cyanobacteriota bacterium]MDW8201881.1 dual specificity protein phosphatase [Cyanobacteriota bacterium SKYGB_h_bin112]